MIFKEMDILKRVKELRIIEKRGIYMCAGGRAGTYHIIYIWELGRQISFQINGERMAVRRVCLYVCINIDIHTYIIYTYMYVLPMITTL